MVLNGYDSPEGSYLFDDGTIGVIGEPDFDIDDYLEDGEDPDDLEVRGMEPVGNIYIDRWKPGRFYDGGLYLYYKGETLRDYCERNGEPLPMRRLPDDVYDLIEDGKWDELKRYYDEVPELKRMMERVWRERTGPSKEDGGPCSSGVGDPPADVSIHGSIGNE